MDCEQIEELHTPLIQGLPDVIAVLCLARVPRRFHHLLRCVSKRWKALLSSEEWIMCRQQNNLEETWIYVMCKDSCRRNCFYALDPDPAIRFWKLIQHLPSQCSKREGMALETLGSKLHLLGGCSWNEDATDEVYRYNSSENSWEEAAPMPTARCYFASATLHEKIYATSGTGTSSTDLCSWDIYDPHSTSWTSSQHQQKMTDIKKLVALDDKIYTIHESTYNVHYAGVYDPAQNLWQPVNNEILSCWRGPTVVVDGTLYMLDETSGTKLMRWQEEKGDWEALGRLSTLLTGPPCQLTAIGRSIFVIGKGLRTVVVNVDKVSKGRLMVSTSLVPGLESNVSVIHCKTITI